MYYGHAPRISSQASTPKAPAGQAKGPPIKNENVPNISTKDHQSPPLTGQYVRHGSKLNGPVDLLMVHRSTTTTAKAQTFVLRVHSTGRREYVSSLWDGPTPGTYALEYKGLRYTVTLTDEVATITSAHGGTPPYINRGSGNSIAA